MHFDEMILFLPKKTGVYKMFDADGVLLYVGKAKDLSKRLKQYVDIEKLEYHKILMRRQVARVEWVVTDTEAEALILEQHLIKTEKPKYNIILKDDKMYPMLALSNDPFPRLYKFRGKIERKKDVFGPFPFISDLHDTIKLVQKICRVRICANSVFNSRKRPCLLHQVGLCTAPCTAPEKEYKNQVALARGILSGRIKSVVTDLSKKMKAASNNRDFEAAARFKKQIEALQSTAKVGKLKKVGN